MRIIISPAKKMRVDTDSLDCRALPCFLEKTDRLREALCALSYDELKRLWKCSDAIAAQNLERLQGMELRRGLTPALLAYEGIQYRCMAPEVFTWAEYEYLQEHLRILSGFYGLLRPFDGVTPYRLEMAARLALDGTKDLYGFWGGSIAQALFAETDTIINLASREYSLCVTRYPRPGVRVVTCLFAEEGEGRLVEKGTLCKMARGEMVRWMAENAVTAPEQLRDFSRQGYRFYPARSDENTYLFLRRPGPARRP